jgi:hypothetical protein
MNHPWLKNLSKLPDKLPSGKLGDDDLYDIIFYPYEIEGLTLSGDVSQAVSPFASLKEYKIPISLMGIYSSKANYAVGFVSVPSSTISVTSNQLTPKGSYWINPDSSRLKMEIVKLPDPTGPNPDYYNRSIGHLHLKMLPREMANALCYSCFRNPFYVNNFLKELNNAEIDIRFLEFQEREQFFKTKRAVKIRAGRDNSIRQFIKFTGGYEVRSDVVVIASTSATGTNADPCIKFVGYINSAGNFVIQQVIVMPYATP